jgi:hypothetical protein
MWQIDMYLLLLMNAAGMRGWVVLSQDIYHVTMQQPGGAFHWRVQDRVLKAILLFILILMLPLPPTFQAQSIAADLAAPHLGMKPIISLLEHLAPAPAAAP